MLRLFIVFASTTALHTTALPHQPQQPQGLRSRLGLVPRSWSLKHGQRYRSDDWLTNIMSLPRSLTLKRVKSHLVANLVVTAAVLGLRWRGIKLAVGPLTHSLSGSFLGLLLVFRTNAAYARFWEARLIWGTVLTAARKLCLCVLSQIEPDDPARAAHILERLQAFPVALARLCTGSTAPLPASVASLLPAGTTSESAAQLLCLQLRLAIAAHCDEVRSRSGASGATDVHAAHVEEEAAHLVGDLVASVGGCERIRGTPVPLTYSRHTSRSLTLWCGTLPLVLVDMLGLAALPAMAGLCWCLFGIEELGHLIEQPFQGACHPRDSHHHQGMHQGSGGRKREQRPGGQEEAARAATREEGAAEAPATAGGAVAAAEPQVEDLSSKSYCFSLPVDSLALRVGREVQLLITAARAAQHAGPAHGLVEAAQGFDGAPRVGQAA